MSDGPTALIRTAVMTDLRNHAPLEDALNAGAGSGPEDRLRTPLTRSSETLPVTLIVDVLGSGGGTGTNHTTVDDAYVVEAGLTVTETWQNERNETAGTNADLAADAIMDAVGERADVSFGTGLEFDGRYGGASGLTREDAGEVNRVSQWQYSLGRKLDVGPYNG